MPSHKEGFPGDGGRLPEHIYGGNEPETVDTSLGYEPSDVRVTGIIVFLASLAIFVVVVAIVCYGLGKVFNARMNHEDGPPTRWTKTVNIRQLGDMPSAPAMQNKVAALMNSFPLPRVQTDDGSQDLADLHERENLLLEHYSWVDQKTGQVRIPIERAMELIAKRGLPVMPAAQLPPLMTGDSRPAVTAPLTNGYAPTAYDQQLQAAANAALREQPGAGSAGEE